MKIAFLIGPFPALSETFILNQITALIDRGHKVDIYPKYRGDTSQMHGDVTDYNLLARTHYQSKMPQSRTCRVVKGVALLCLHFWKAPMILLRTLNIFKYGRPAMSLELLYTAIPFLPGKSYDIVHCHFGTSGVMGALLRDIGALQGKLLTSFHGADVNVYPRDLGLNVYRQLFQRGDLYTANTTFTGNRAVALGCPEHKIIKLPVGLDVSSIAFQQRRRRMGAPVRIITVARLVEKKGIEYSIKAIAQLVKKHPEVEYQIVGHGELRKSFEQLIRELGLSEKVHLLGSKTQAEIRELYKRAHIFLLSSVTASNGDQEGQGLVLQEAQAAGLPVLSTLHNGIPEGLLDGKSGFLVPERDVNALAERLNYLIEHPEIWPSMGQIGRAYVEKQFDISKLTDALVEIYEQLLRSFTQETRTTKECDPSTRDDSFLSSPAS